MTNFICSLRSLFLLLVLATGYGASATHLVGGNLGYTYIGETAPGSQIYRYRVYMQFYLNCGGDSNWQTIGGLLNTNGGSLPVGVYIQNPQSPNANKTRQTTVNLTLVDSSLIVPNLPGGCTVGAGLCTKLGVISGTVDLPLNFGGYHLYFQMNARNGAISNLLNPGMTGIGYYAFIPPPLLPNSSPIWLGDPTPLLCISDTSTFINSATDPDGDQLIFSFETPYNSITGGGGIIPPPVVLPNTIPVVTYLAGHSVAQPFGAGGYAFINGATGLTRYRPPIQGNYVVAVEVKEYRNGILIGRTRRDLQLQAVVCPPNSTPQPLNAQPTTYTVQAGEQICFDLAFQDTNADSLQLLASGTIFNGALFNPPATINSPVSGVGTVASIFCWDTECAQGQSQPYLFSVSVSDNGCPPRTLDVVYQVNVVPFLGPTVITGPGQVCSGQTSSAYSTPPIAGATFTWSASGGTIATGQGSNSVTVNWGAAGNGTVQVTATNGSGCTSAPTSLPVTIAPLPVVNAGNDATVCPGSSVQLGGAPTGPAGSSFIWTPAAGLNNTNTANPTASPATTTDYIVQVSNNGCARRDTVRITVAQPQVEAGNDIGFCAGGSVQLGAIGNGGFTWAPAAGLSAINIADPIANPSSTTTYTVTVTDAAGCSIRDSVTVSVNQLPVAMAGDDLTPCEGTTAMLGGAPTGPLGSTFEWLPAVGLDNANASNPTLSVTVDAEFVVIVTDMNQCVRSDTVSIAVLQLPNVNAGPDLSVCAGESTQLQGSGTGNLLWTPAFGLSDTSIPDPICNPESTITYTLTVTGTNTCTNSDQATVTVNVLPNANAGIDRTICIGDSVMIGTSSPGDLIWSPATGLSATNVATPMASPAVTTTYVVTLTDAMMCNAVDSVVVNVVPSTFAGDDGAFSTCSSGSATDLFTQLGGIPDGSGVWTGPNGSSHSGQLDPAMDQAGVYTYVVGAGTMCVDSAQVQVAIIEPTVSFTGGNTICTGDSTQITGGGGITFLWTPATGVSDPAIAAPWFSPSSTTSFTLTVTDNGGCVGSGEITVNVNSLPVADAGVDAVVCLGNGTTLGGASTGPAGSTFSWTPTADLNDATLSNPILTPTVTATYTVVVTDPNQCIGQDDILITVIELPALEAGNDVAVCMGESTQLGATGTGTFTWTPTAGLNNPSIADPVASPTTTTAYTVVLSDANGCFSTDGLTVTVNALPIIDAGVDTWLCQGSTVGLVGSGDAGSYAWSPAPSLNDPSSLTPNATPDMTTTYTIVVTDANDCTASDMVTITVGVDPPIDAGSNQITCAGIPVTLGGSPTSVPGSTYQWSPNTALDDATAANPVATPITTTEYILVVSNDTCTSTSSVTVTMGTQGVAAFTTRFEAGCEGLRGFFNDNSVGAVTREWDMGNGIMSNAANVQVMLPYGQASTVTLTITDASGCVETISETYNNASYNELVDIDIPNIFTPNGDGKNDVFTLDTEAFLGPCTEMEVMNRWGEKVFISQGSNITWDGRTFSGEPATEGTYFYVIGVKDLKFQGTVLLTR